MIKVDSTHSVLLEELLNDIGIENVLYIFPEYSFNKTLFVVIYKSDL